MLLCHWFNSSPCSVTNSPTCHTGSSSHPKLIVINPNVVFNLHLKPYTLHRCTVADRLWSRAMQQSSPCLLVAALSPSVVAAGAVQLEKAARAASPLHSTDLAPSLHIPAGLGYFAFPLLPLQKQKGALQHKSCFNYNSGFSVQNIVRITHPSPFQAWLSLQTSGPLFWPKAEADPD